MHNNFYVLKPLAAELHEKLHDFELVAVFSQEKDELVLGFHNKSSEFFIKCVANSEFSCLYFPSEFGRAKRNSVNLWPEVLDLKVLNVAIIENERAIKIELTKGFLILIKMYGNRPNVLLFKQGQFAGMFNNNLLIDKEIRIENLGRELDFTKNTFCQNNGDLKKLYPTFGKIIFEDYIQKTRSQDLNQKWKYFADLEQYLIKPKFYIGHYNEKPVLSVFPLDGNRFESAIDALNAFYVFYNKEFTLKNSKKYQENALKKELRKVENYIEKTKIKLNALKSKTPNEHIANILMANLHTIPSNSEKIELLNFYTNEPLEIDLKKEISPQKNAENFYRKSKNEKKEFDKIEENILTAKQKTEEIAAQMVNLEQIESYKDLKQQFLKNKTKPENQEDKTKHFKVFEIMNYKILVGKNAKSNDLLTTQYAHKDDLWLHARDCAGSHVVIKKKDNSPIPQPVIEAAASIAAFYSKKKTEKTAAVIVTKKKHVRKGKGMKEGEVIVEKETTVLVEPLEFKEFLVS